MLVFLLISGVLFTNFPQTIYAADIQLHNDSFGTVNQSLGIILQSLTAADVASIRNSFPNHDVSIKLINPTSTMISSNQFQDLYQDVYNFYFSFSDGTA